MLGKSKDHDITQNHPLPDEVIKHTSEIVETLQKSRKSRLLVLILHQSIGPSAALDLSNVMRRMGEVDTLDVLMESGGGNLDFAYKILRLLKSYAKQVTVIVPFYAKSAATLIALGADRLQMCRAGELGPIDPQVIDPDSNIMVPAVSIKSAMDFIAEVDDPLIKASLTDKISPMLMGAYRNAEAMSKQYLDEILATKKFDDSKREDLVGLFTEMMHFHGYPMSIDFLEKHGVPVDALSESEESLFADLHEQWIKYCRDVYAVDAKQAGQMLILQSTAMTLVKLNNIVIRNQE